MPAAVPPDTVVRSARRPTPALLFAAVLLIHTVVVTWLTGWTRFTDLRVYWEAARAVRRGEPLYGNEFVTGGLFFTYPPFAEVVFSPLALLPFPAVAVLWYALSIAALVDSCVSLTRWGAAAGWRPVPPLLIASVALLCEPVQSSLGFGQINLLLLALLLRDASGRGPLPKGMLTGACAAIKLTPAAYGLYFLVTRQVRPIGVAAATVVGTVALSAAVLPAATKQFWLDGLVLDAGRAGSAWYLMNQSVPGVLCRLLGGEAGQLAALPVSLVIVAATAYLAVRAVRAGDAPRAFALVSLVPLLISPISWTHHWVTLLVPLTAVVAAPLQVSWRARGAVLGFATLMLVARLPVLLPHGGDVELAYGPAAQLLAAGYAVLGGVLLFVLGRSPLIQMHRP